MPTLLATSVCACAQQYAYCMEDNCYELLGVEKDAGGLTIKRAYRKLATEWCAS